MTDTPKPIAEDFQGWFEKTYPIYEQVLTSQKPRFGLYPNVAEDFKCTAEAAWNARASLAEAQLSLVTGERDRQYEFNASQIAKVAQLEAQREAAEAERDRFKGVHCGTCEGSGSVDSGGIHPWGEAIFVKCGMCDGKPSVPANWFEDSSLDTWFPLTAKELVETKAERDALKLQVAQLREALEKLARLGNGNFYGNSIGNCIAQDALAKTQPGK